VVKENILTALETRIVVADGAFGTELYEAGVSPAKCYEHLNIEDPEIVAGVHRRYIEAGAELIETNTFEANRNKLSFHQLGDAAFEINKAGARIARACAGDTVWVAGSMGPLGRFENFEPDEAEKALLFREQASGLAEGGVDLFILETFPSLDELLCALGAVKSVSALPVIAQLLLTAEGKTLSGDDPLTAFLVLKERGADIVGANCGVGPRGISRVMKDAARYVGGFVSAFPNAGFPEKVGGRTLYLANTDYLVRAAVEMVKDGVNLVGGCCGTRPADIGAMKRALAGTVPAVKSPVGLEEALDRQKKTAAAEEAPKRTMKGGKFRSLWGRKKIVIVELDPPRGLNYETVVEGARALKTVGADCISVAENPLAMVRMSNVTLARLIEERAGIETIVHLTCRDRNLIGLQSALMGMAVDGIKNILAVTGDPPPKGGEETVRGVFDLNSLKLISLIRSLNEGRDYHGNDIKKNTPFAIGASFNPNTGNMEAQAGRMRKKIDRGAMFFQTQPVFSKEKIDEMSGLLEDISAPVFVGILPLYSYNNALFLHNEFPGISIPPEVLQSMKEAGKHERERGMEIALELMRYAVERFPGIYIMPPFNKHEIAAALIKRLKR
jgi:homocysteine S-methyltransferase